MPLVDVSNFEVKGDFDGRARAFTARTADKDGGFDLDIYIRAREGILVKALTIRGVAYPEPADQGGGLRLYVEANNDVLYEVIGDHFDMGDGPEDAAYIVAER